MNVHEYAFIVVATIGSIAALAVVTARNHPLHAPSHNWP